MKDLIIKRKIDFSGFGTWKWNEADYNKPLTISVGQSKFHFFIKKDELFGRDLQVFPSGYIEIVFSPPPKALVKALHSKGQAAVEAAEKIYQCYVEAYEKFQSLLMSSGKVTRLLYDRPMSIHAFFEIRGGLLGESVSWSIDGGETQYFKPNLPRTRRKNPLYKADQLVTFKKWQRMQDAADNGDFPSGEVLELLAIRSKAHWREKKVATIEAAIIAESLLRTYAIQILKQNGFSNRKIKALGDELTFNNMLNIVLPLSLTKAELKRVSSPIQAVDLLRKLRNDLVHGNISETDVDETNIEKGINGALSLADFLKKKVKKK